MGAVRKVVAVAAFALVAATSQAWAQEAPTASPRGWQLPGTNSYLGLNVSRASTATDAPCPATALVCGSHERERLAVYAGTMFSPHWGAELAYVNTGRMWRAGNEARAQGLNFSVVGRTQLLPSVGLFGRVGTVYGRSDTTAVMGNSAAVGPDQGFGLSFGGGVSYDVTPRLSATLELDSQEYRFAGGGREPVRSVGLGLKYRY
jgi:opacity protein-like surface antigen